MFRHLLTHFLLSISQRIHVALAPLAISQPNKRLTPEASTSAPLASSSACVLFA
jgi:hypothetical protein